jgi:hypothetical protein
MLKIYEIVFTACLLANSQSCKEVPIQTLDNPPSFYECLRQPMPTIADWLVDHPEYFFKKVYCGPQRMKI